MQRFDVVSKDVIGVKRFNLPLVIKAKCPTCNTECEHDFADNYLMYPKINSPEGIGIRCLTCDDYFNANIVLKIAVELDETSIKPQK